jgi:hypothetical protein
MSSPLNVATVHVKAHVDLHAAGDTCRDGHTVLNCMRKPHASTGSFYFLLHVGL